MLFRSESIEYGKALFQKMGLQAQFYVGDILNDFPLEHNAVDWVFSSGVLEHFTDEQIIAILKKSAAVSRKGVMSLVPNSHCLFYRIGKHAQEMAGTWPYGKETPKPTMRPYFEAAGLKDIQEYSIGTYHALQFWGSQHKEIKEFFGHLSPEEIYSLNQGYLLFTIGTINGSTRFACSP